ncbi:Signal peptidase complex catalytic subunit SEC11C [Chelonia mydas]|uniref:Signal peptidase complex catalytic subunit SEC11C n=1 Tax=Chelonia mydas TaxID=8469 RepID=M7AUQ0_CHEMY|nr:Signal peptidase complex catalytic subunit SEC11C [Chelonia mydas]
MDVFEDLRRMNKRQLYYQVLNFAMIVSSALMIWKGLIVITGSESPIVVVLRENGNIKFLTKGDNNEVDDRGLYKEGQNWLEKKDVVGRARGFLPYVGMVTIIMNDYPKFKNIGQSQRTFKLWRASRTSVQGHLMGKKSTGDFPYVYEEENKIPFSALPENVKQLGDYLQWEETLKNLLRLLEENENRSAQTLREELPWYTKNTWETDDDSSFKDVSLKQEEKVYISEYEQKPLDKMKSTEQFNLMQLPYP